MRKIEETSPRFTLQVILPKSEVDRMDAEAEKISAESHVRLSRSEFARLMIGCVLDDVPRPLRKLLGGQARKNSSTGFRDLDVLLGDDSGTGLPRGTIVKLSGGPGVGKSTLLTQVAASLADECLIVSTEESKHAVVARIRRVAGEQAVNRVDVVSTIDDDVNTEYVCGVMRSHGASVVMIDSVSGLGKNPHDNAVRLIKEVNKHGISLVMMCHLTKGTFAALQEVDSMVDVVAFMRLSGGPNSSTRVVSCSKNRISSSTHQVAEFDMTPHGLVPVTIQDPKKKKR